MIQLFNADCRIAMQAMIDSGVQVHSVVTDPPYGLTSTVKRFGKPGSAPAQSNGATGVYARASRGFMGQLWDGTAIERDPALWRLCYDLLPPGGYLAAFGGTRTFHRIACAIEDAGFEIRDTVMWLYGSGFPKSHNVANSIDKLRGSGPRGRAIPFASSYQASDTEKANRLTGNPVDEYAALTPEAAVWTGFGTALKPAWEPITLARKPLVGTVAANVLAHGVGALNIDGCRVPMSQRDADYIAKWIGGFNATRSIGGTHALGGGLVMDRVAAYDASKGRWPANVLHDGSEEVVSFFPRAPGQQGRARTDGIKQTSVALGDKNAFTRNPEPRGDSGSAARFFYCAKASRADRDGSTHPTIKPTRLMQWLARLVTPPGGTVLDPFMGSGSTGKAAVREGFSFIGVEQSEGYFRDAERRIGASLDYAIFSELP